VRCPRPDHPYRHPSAKVYEGLGDAGVAADVADRSVAAQPGEDDLGLLLAVNLR